MTGTGELISESRENRLLGSGELSKTSRQFPDLFPDLFPDFQQLLPTATSNSYFQQLLPTATSNSYFQQLLPTATS
ncbi:MAG: hypothetical protein ACI92S_004201, partial [Planctomycetaceae bacterium]